MKYEIGQQVYRATFEAHRAWVVCPDCGGEGRIRVILYDNEEVSVECRNCSSGYNPPSGWIAVHDRVPRAELETIIGLEIGEGKVQWRTSGTYRIEEEKLFDNEADAMVAAKALAEQWDREERERVFKKEKDSRSWAWNATYHRKCIKDAQKQIEYHTSKLAVASLKAKEDKAK